MNKPGLIALSVSLALASSGAHANGYGENSSWQFQTPGQKSANISAADMIERKKGGYYDSFSPVYNIVNQTWVDRQYNCSQSATAQANAGTNTMSATTSSPVLNSTADLGANTSANGAYNGYGSDVSSPFSSGVGAVGVMTGAYPTDISSGQYNSGRLSSSVNDSLVSSSLGNVRAGGYSDQVLNSEQKNFGTQAASINGSAACVTGR